LHRLDALGDLHQLFCHGFGISVGTALGQSLGTVQARRRAPPLSDIAVRGRAFKLGRALSRRTVSGARLAFESPA
jgi:hypothetical protein